MPEYALMNNPSLAVKPKGKIKRHAECGGDMEPVGTDGKWICLNCAKVGYPL